MMLLFFIVTAFSAGLCGRSSARRRCSSGLVLAGLFYDDIADTLL